jgi:hypothetical protein
MTCSAKEALTCRFRCHLVYSSCHGYLRVAAPINHTLVCNGLTQHTRRASCMLHSASSSRCYFAPRSTMVQAPPQASPEKWLRLSPPIMISSMRLHPTYPLSSAVGT